ncbi:MAG: hypothetical protein IPP28_00275 [Xanthomonadales bacterium]|nr:hypothetical protein [Xanthomonadales bacterium]
MIQNDDQPSLSIIDVALSGRQLRTTAFVFTVSMNVAPSSGFHYGPTMRLRTAWPAPAPTSTAARAR